jgi:calcineurin-like phosphoesterase
MQTFIATVEYYEEIKDEMEKDTVVVQADNYADAVGLIEKSFGDSIESIVSITGISDMNVIHLGNSEFVDKIIEVLLKENSY